MKRTSRLRSKPSPHSAVGGVKGAHGYLESRPVVQVDAGKYILGSQRRFQCAQPADIDAERMLDEQRQAIGGQMVELIAPGLAESQLATTRRAGGGEKAKASEIGIGHD